MAEKIAYLIAAASVIGTIANSFQKKWCFYIWGCTNTFWIIHNFRAMQYAQVLLYIFNLATCIIGLIKWKRPHNRKHQTKKVHNYHELKWPDRNENEEKLHMIFGAETATEMISRAKMARESIKPYIK